MEVPVRELKNRLSEYLRRVQAGEEIVVTSRGKAVARLLAPRVRRRKASAEEDAIARLRSQPWIIPPRQHGKPQGSDRPVSVPPGTTEEIVRWVRGG